MTHDKDPNLVIESLIERLLGPIVHTVDEPQLLEEARRTTDPSRLAALYCHHLPPAAEGPEALAPVWVEGGVRASAQRKHEAAREVFRRWCADAVMKQAGFGGSDPERDFEHLQRTLSALALAIHNARPADAPSDAAFHVRWSAADGLGRWDGAPAETAALPLRQAAENCARLVGGFPAPLAAAVAQQIVLDLRGGLLTLSRLPLRKSLGETSRYGWDRPVVDASEPASAARGPLAAATASSRELRARAETRRPKAAPAALAATPEAAEAILRTCFPVLGELYDQGVILIERAVAGKADVAGLSASLRQALSELGVSASADVWRRVQEGVAGTRLEAGYREEDLQDLEAVVETLSEQTGLPRELALRFLLTPFCAWSLLAPAGPARERAAQVVNTALSLDSRKQEQRG